MAADPQKEVGFGKNGHRKGFVGWLGDPKIGVNPGRKSRPADALRLRVWGSGAGRVEPVGLRGGSERDDPRYRARSP
ncbi:hypothetical protein MPNT_10241 [Candidatus Methylacidithermus pantelleriae]|uniref:Uncharacterized protein n=1 Tax=Candidatus Methylacidithermus pantelleriae TaxID=2744239 RepID=A0A8J2FRB2_9BACT|nr:hypothetical protein MPNT_10241 [Candidatus Methylacidithermus pantelleriae]